MVIDDIYCKTFMVKLTTSAGYCSFRVHWEVWLKTQLSSINHLTFSSSLNLLAIIRCRDQIIAMQQMDEQYLDCFCSWYMWWPYLPDQTHCYDCAISCKVSDAVDCGILQNYTSRLKSGMHAICSVSPTKGITHYASIDYLNVTFNCAYLI